MGEKRDQINVRVIQKSDLIATVDSGFWTRVCEEYRGKKENVSNIHKAKEKR